MCDSPVAFDGSARRERTIVLNHPVRGRDDDSDASADSAIGEVGLDPLFLQRERRSTGSIVLEARWMAPVLSDILVSVAARVAGAFPRSTLVSVTHFVPSLI